MQSTQLIYLKNTYLYHLIAKILDIRTLEDGRLAVILDQTIFYPQGGGQPCDSGSISSSTAQFFVTDVRLDKEGVVFHIGTFGQAPFKPDEIVMLTIDQKRREQNAKLHSAGHLIDCAVIQLGLKIKPTKGYAFPEGPYVEYEGSVENIPEIVQLLQEKINSLIASDISVVIQELLSEQAQKQGINVPAGKSARIVSFQGFEPCGCGGTHVRSSREIGSLIIRKIKAKSGFTRVSYEVQ